MPHLRALLRTAARICRDTAMAEDLVQETLLRAWSRLDQFQVGTNCKAWLFTILLHLWGRRREKASSRLEVVGLDPREETRAPSASLEEHVMANEVLGAVDGLAEDQRAALLLSAVEGFSVNEIAEMLAVPAGTVMSRLGRARSALRASLNLRPQPCASGGEKGSYAM